MPCAAVKRSSRPSPRRLTYCRRFADHLPFAESPAYYVRWRSIPQIVRRQTTVMPEVDDSRARKPVGPLRFTARLDVAARNKPRFVNARRFSRCADDRQKGAERAAGREAVRGAAHQPRIVNAECDTPEAILAIRHRRRPGTPVNRAIGYRAIMIFPRPVRRRLAADAASTASTGVQSSASWATSSSSQLTSRHRATVRSCHRGLPL